MCIVVKFITIFSFAGQLPVIKAEWARGVHRNNIDNRFHQIKYRYIMNAVVDEFILIVIYSSSTIFYLFLYIGRFKLVHNLI